MAQNKLKFSLTAYDPTPSEVTLAFDAKQCIVEESSGANISVEEYKTTPEGGPSEIFLKVTPDPIAFVMKFVDGKMTIEFRGNWAAFQVSNAGPASTDICFKVHIKGEDVEPVDIRMNWNFEELKRLNGDGIYEIVHQQDTEKGRLFIIAISHPETGQTYIIRGCVKNDRVTIYNTDVFNDDQMMAYLAFYVKDEGKIKNILAEIDANPNYKLAILYKWGCFAEPIDVGSFIPHLKHMDKQGNVLPNKDKEDDDHVRKGRELQKKAADSGKKGGEAPEDGSEWSCGKVKWELPKDDKKYRDVGKLKIPDLGTKDEGPHLQDVGKLQWGGFNNEEPKPVEKEKPKVGKLNIGAFGGGPAEDVAPPPKRSWKKKGAKEEKTPEA